MKNVMRGGSSGAMMQGPARVTGKEPLPVTDLQLRQDPVAAALYARERLERGASPAELLRGLYGVTLPLEFWVCAKQDLERLDLPLLRSSLPWNLIVPLEEGGPRLDDPFLSETERRALRLLPDLVPLCTLAVQEARHGGTFLGYDRRRLEVGDATVLGLRKNFLGSPEPRVLGPSLIAVLEAWVEDQLRMWTERMTHEGAYWRHFDDEPDSTEQMLARVRRLAQRVEAARRPR